MPNNKFWFWVRFVVGMTLMFLACGGLLYYMVEYAAPAAWQGISLGP